ncbi:PREDICTED: globin-like [Nicrophorus vespilloides]|uniref:Globin-like n=1 Tax=Nicrophorus vespilloides TaxID=110193 RepID=A0ABM1M0K1_NICVS|nr:PREDICTED: globin-like [Nicrophorus vespilloides]
MGKEYSKLKNDSFGISAEEKKLFIDSWTILRTNPGYYGVCLFIIFFEKFPEHKSYYSRIKFDEIPDLRAYPDLTLHGLRVMRQFSTIAEYIDKPEMLVQTLYQHTMSHQKRKITVKAYDDMRKCILMLLTNKLNASGEVLLAWNKILTTLFKIITDMNAELQLDTLDIDGEWAAGRLL